MAALLHKLTSKPSTLKLLTAFNIPQSPHLPISLSLLLHQPHFSQIKADELTNQNPLWGSPNTDKIDFSQPFPINYPSFPFGYHPNPISSTGLDPPLEEDEANGCGDEQTVWADSVKKKRKKKMNKHKYRKLRKRIGRQT